MSDLGDRLTGQALAGLEARVAAVYGEAARELQGTIEAYFEGFEKRDDEMKALIGQTVNGRVWTEQDYAQWRLSQIGRGERYQALRERIAQRYTQANETAVAYVNDATPGLYALNRNYAAYAIEQAAGDVGFDLWDEQTVKRLIVEQPELMPYYPPERALRRGIDLAYGRRQITASVTSSILQGKGLKAMADDLQTRMRDMNRDSAIRTARTAVTGAQNAGRMDSYAAAERMGLTLKKRWMATMDGRTRHSHARLDGETVLPGEAFSNGCRFPGDPQGPAHEVYNCRCTLVAELPGMGVKDASRRARNPLTGQNEVVQGQTFEQWAKEKRAENKLQSPGKSGIMNKDAPKKPKASKEAQYDYLFKEANNAGITYKGVEKRAGEATQDELVAALGGEDRTGGSCASVGLAYIGQRQGYDVLDFRDGESRELFSNTYNLYMLSRADGMKTLRAKGASSMTVGKRLIEQCESGKEYLLSVGKHVSVVRKTEDGVLQYLELQTKAKNGWRNFCENPKVTLGMRFSCTSTSNNMSELFDFMIDIDESNFETDEFRQLLGYLNTAGSRQKKGRSG